MSQYKNSNEAFEALKEYMTSKYGAKVVSGGREILKRCHFCGDSSNPADAHMYIGDMDGLIVYNCFKCNAKGLVDGKFLRDLGCYDTGIMSLCIDQNKKSTSSKPANSGVLRNTNSNFIRRFLNIPDSNNEFAIKKLNYVSNRLGYNVDYNMCKEFKIVLNLKEFLNYNNITNYSRHENLMDDLDKFFIGFLSMDNSHVILRRLVPEGKLSKYIDYRYLNYDIYGGYNNIDNGLKFYSIPKYIYLDRPLELHIAEGAFDIIAIYKAFNHVNTNGIFASVCGKAYSSLIRHFIVNYGFMNINIHIYPDLDVQDREILRMRDELHMLGCRIFIHRNVYEGEKDYGVHYTHIIDNVMEV